MSFAHAPAPSRLTTAALLGALCLSVAGCGMSLGLGDGAAPTPQRPYNLSLDMYAAALTLVQEKYVDAVPPSRLALSGLQGLKKLDPTLTIADENGALTIAAPGKPPTRARRPSDDAIPSWAQTMVDVGDKAREVSPKLAALPINALYKAQLDGVTELLDGVSRYEEPDVARDNRAHREGFGGVGVRIDATDPRLVQAVLPDTPAARVGVKAGDLIRAVDGKTTDGTTIKGLIAMLRGPVGADVTMTLERKGSPKPFDVRITRAHIADPTVIQRAVGDAHYLRITDFTLSTPAEVEDAVAAAQSVPGRTLQGFILDLRNNPGGLLEQGVNVADLFLQKGRIFSSRGRHPKSQQTMNATPGDVAKGLPIIVLINGRSASAAEILAAALQDQGRALLVGSSSYGKGTIQTLDSMPNGGDMILTWARLYSPSGYWFTKVGVAPNICLQGDAPNLRATLEQVRSEQFDPNKPVLVRRASDAKPNRDAPQKACPQYLGDRAQDAELLLAQQLLADGPTVARLMRAASQIAAQ